MLFRSYIGSYLPSGKRLHVVEVNVQDEDNAHALYSVAPNTVAKPVTSTPHGREQRHVNAYTLGRLREQAKWLTVAPNMAATQILYLCEEAVLRKNTFYIK